MSKVSKESVDYSHGMKASHCGKVFNDDRGYCKHFIRHHDMTDRGECQIVSGAIDPIYWCKKFAKAKR